MGFSPGFSGPALKRIKVELISATLERCSPLLKERAPTKLLKGTAFRPFIVTQIIAALAAEGPVLS
jgi:hypothetical protein